MVKARAAGPLVLLRATGSSLEEMQRACGSVWRGKEVRRRAPACQQVLRSQSHSLERQSKWAGAFGDKGYVGTGNKQRNQPGQGQGAF